jgi:hypothetical protein
VRLFFTVDNFWVFSFHEKFSGFFRVSGFHSLSKIIFKFLKTNNEIEIQHELTVKLTVWSCMECYSEELTNYEKVQSKNSTSFKTFFNIPYLFGKICGNLRYGYSFSQKISWNCSLQNHNKTCLLGFTKVQSNNKNLK